MKYKRKSTKQFQIAFASHVAFINTIARKYFMERSWMIKDWVFFVKLEQLVSHSDSSCSITRIEKKIKSITGEVIKLHLTMSIMNENIYKRFVHTRRDIYKLSNPLYRC